MKKLAFVGGAAGLGLMALLQTPLTDAADHLDNTALATNPMADLNDVYAWMTTDANQINLAMTIAPFAPATNTPTFGPSVLYAFHITSRPGFAMAGVESKIICKFASNTMGECWVVNPMGKVVDYVSGDLSGAAGRASASGKFRVFAGLRSDPFFFNLGGFKNAVTAAVTACGGNCPGALTPDAAGCPQINKATGDALRGAISTAPTAALSATNPCPPGQIDCFATYNTMAIVVQVDKSQVVSGMDKLVTVWASTHAGS